MYTKKNAIISVLAVVILSVGIVSVLLFNHSRANPGHVSIDNLADCSKNATSGTIDDVETGVYKLVKSANDYNKLTTAKSYHGTVRKGSCQNSNHTITDNTTGRKQSVQTSTIIVDIPEAKQSWKIAYDWLYKSAGSSNIDLGTIQPSCLKVDQLLYGDFKCDNIMSLAKFGTDKVDPILPYMPYSGVGFRLDYEPDTKTVTVVLQPPSGTQDTLAFNENTKAIIPYWFQKRGLDQNNYKIVYSSDIDGHENEESN